MAYNEKLAERTREIISVSHKKVEEKKMFGGLCFMVNGKMCVGAEAFFKRGNITLHSADCTGFVQNQCPR